jgi:nucleoside triphosphate pyrophosphatase
MNLSLVLASKSPRRKQLLKQLGYQFSCQNADVDESILANECAKNYVLRVAIAKAQAISELTAKNCLVLGADTCVVVDEKILAKPVDLADSQRILNLLSDRQHQVLTAVALVHNEIVTSVVVTTEVFFKVLTSAEILKYWQSGEPQDKAGSYGIQGFAGQFVTHIHGSYSAVVGLPLYETEQLLADFTLLKS